MKRVTPRENLLRTLRRQGFDWVPVDQNSFCPDQVEAFKKRFGHDRIAEHFENPTRGAWMRERATFTDPKALYPREELPEDIGFNGFGVGHSRRPGCFHMTRMHHPLKGDATVSEIANHPFPVIEASQEEIDAMVRGIQEQGFAATASMACSVWETAWYMRSMEDLMVDMLTDDERGSVLLDRVTAFSCERARMYAKARVDVLMTGDDIGMQSTPMMDPELWRRWLKPRFAKVIAAAREAKPDILVWYHSCGYVLPFIGDLLEVGVDILNPIQPECMDLADIHAQYGGRLSYWSTIGTQKVLPFGTPEEVRSTVRRNIDICGKDGGIVIGPTHMVEPEVPWENLEAMRLAAKDYYSGFTSHCPI
ncbi:MAG: hypothetical protein FWF84_04535 [Kiritimatiellaeota bacterium]|nr:hypothetical protein [Kiritimatiellota bacterium]